MSEEIIFARMSVEHVSEVLAIQEECNISPWGAEDYENALNEVDSLLFVAQFGAKVVGFISARLIMRGNLCEILNIGVTPKLRNKQIEEGLIFLIFSSLPAQIKLIWLEVRAGNKAAICFYQKHGFKVTGKRKNFYRDPAEDALLMQKEIG